MRYEFVFTDPVADDALAELPPLTRSTVPGRPTTLYGRVRDAAELHGLLARIRLLRLDLAEVHRLPD